MSKKMWRQTNRKSPKCAKVSMSELKIVTETRKTKMSSTRSSSLIITRASGIGGEAEPIIIAGSSSSAGLDEERKAAGHVHTIYDA